MLNEKKIANDLFKLSQSLSDKDDVLVHPLDILHYITGILIEEEKAGEVKYELEKIGL